ncbi:MAG: hypothetical protein KF716_13440 [Anaerolineae bacterium]|nr:hypothetical protein [Anaerolineae bacterium]
MRINRRLWFAIIAMVVLTSIPYLVALFSAPSGTSFSGVIGNWVDFNSHLAKMQQGYRGEWLYQILFTTEPHSGALLQTYYVALGQVARITGLSLVVTYHLARIICTALMVWAIWGFLRHYLTENQAWWALLLTLFSGGVGYLLYILAPAMTAEVSPIEFWLQDGYMWLASFSFPHFAAGIALLLLAMLMIERWAEGKPGSLLTLLVASLGVGIVQPFGLPLVDIIMLIVILWRVLRHQPETKLTLAHAIVGGALVAIAHGALLGYDFVFLYKQPVWAEFTVQNVTLSPAPIYYLFGYAPLLIPALLTIIRLIINKLRLSTITRRKSEVIVPMTAARPPGSDFALIINKSRHTPNPVDRTPNEVALAPQGSTEFARNDRLKLWDRWLLPILWIVFVAVLLYAPLNTQRRYTLGIQAPLAALTVFWFVEVGIPALRRRFRRRTNHILIIYGAISTLSTLLVLLLQLHVTADTHDRTVYYTDDMFAAWQWVRDNTYPYDTVLGSFQSGGQLVAQTGRRTVLGHWIETVDYLHKREEVSQFFDPQVPDSWRWKFMSQQGVSYLWYGEEERRLGTWSPSSIRLLNPVYENSSITIYRVDWAR